jgi:hypothetical protein
VARRKAPRLPDPGAAPGRLLAFDEAQWADDRADAALLPGGEYENRGLLRFRRRQRWHSAQQEWSVSNGLHRYYLLHLVHGQAPAHDRRT